MILTPFIGVVISCALSVPARILVERVLMQERDKDVKLCEWAA